MPFFSFFNCGILFFDLNNRRNKMKKIKCFSLLALTGLALFSTALTSCSSNSYIDIYGVDSEKNELKNRYTHIRYVEQAAVSKGGQKTSSSGQRKWSETTQKIYILIKENPAITRKELCDTLSINPSAIQKHIDKLKNDGVIIRKGGAKGGHWEVIQ